MASDEPVSLKSSFGYRYTSYSDKQLVTFEVPVSSAQHAFTCLDAHLKLEDSMYRYISTSSVYESIAPGDGNLERECLHSEFHLGFRQHSDEGPGFTMTYGLNCKQEHTFEPGRSMKEYLRMTLYTDQTPDELRTEDDIDEALKRTKEWIVSTVAKDCSAEEPPAYVLPATCEIPFFKDVLSSMVGKDEKRHAIASVPASPRAAFERIMLVLKEPKCGYRLENPEDIEHITKAGDQFYIRLVPRSENAKVRCIVCGTGNRKVPDVTTIAVFIVCKSYDSVKPELLERRAAGLAEFLASAAHMSDEEYQEKLQQRIDQLKEEKERRRRAEQARKREEEQRAKRIRLINWITACVIGVAILGFVVSCMVTSSDSSDTSSYSSSDTSDNSDTSNSPGASSYSSTDSTDSSAYSSDSSSSSSGTSSSGSSSSRSPRSSSSSSSSRNKSGDSSMYIDKDGTGYIFNEDGSREVTDGYGNVVKDKDGDGDADSISTDGGQTWSSTD